MTTIGVIGMGQMGAAIARRLVDNGAEVLTLLEGRSAESAARAAAAGAKTATPARMAGEAEMILSVVPPALAAEVAAALLPSLEAAAEPALYLDCNAIAPQTVGEIAALFASAHLPFADASLIGGPPATGGAGPRLYMSGDVADAAAQLAALGLDARVLSGTIGDASALKMAYGGITKGIQAIGAAMALGAYRRGAGESLVAELADSQPAVYAALARQLPAMLPKAYRWDGEMREIARFLEPDAGASAMLMGAAELYRDIGEAAAEGPGSEIVDRLQRFCAARS